MDIDIDDILAELDRDTTAVASSSDPNFPSTAPIGANSSIQHDITQTTALHSDGDYYNKYVNIFSAEHDYKNLVKHWRNERCAPELLPFPNLLMSRMITRIQEQLEHIENISMGFLENEGIYDVDVKEEKDTALNNGKLPLLCMEAELERVKFVIRSYLRCRLNKIDKYSLYLRQIGGDGAGLISLDTLMSKHELEYHEKHSIILLKLFNNSALKHMPPKLQAINDTEGSVSMIEEPNWKKFVFIYVSGPGSSNLNDDPMLELGEDGKYFYTVNIPEFDEIVELTIGSIYVMRYNIIKNLLEENKVILI